MVLIVGPTMYRGTVSCEYYDSMIIFASVERSSCVEPYMKYVWIIQD
jgi:hypothetical protein